MSIPGNLKIKRKSILSGDQAQEDDRRRIVDWLSKSLSPGTDEFVTYRMRNAAKAGFPFEADLVDLAGKFAFSATEYRDGRAGFQAQEATYWLMRVWTELIHRHDLPSARKVAGVLRTWEKRKPHAFHHRLGRTVAYMYPRIAVSLTIGYCSLLGAGPLREYLSVIASTAGGCCGFRAGYFPTLLSLATVSLMFALVEVLRTAGDMTWGVVHRTRTMIGRGGLYAVVCGTVHHGLKTWLHRGPCIPYSVLMAAMALAIGFAAQLFWQERPISDPI